MKKDMMCLQLMDKILVFFIYTRVIKLASFYVTAISESILLEPKYATDLP